MALAKSRCSNDAGFSLIEVLAAMVILTVALVSLAQLFALSTRANFSCAVEHLRGDAGAAEDGTAARPHLGLRHPRPAGQRLHHRHQRQRGHLRLRGICRRRQHGPVAVALGHPAAEHRRLGRLRRSERLHRQRRGGRRLPASTRAAGPSSRCRATRTTR